MTEKVSYVSESLEELKGQEFEVPNIPGGRVKIVDFMGDDSSIVQAARVSYGLGIKDYTSDRRLIRYLIRKRHTSPFEQNEIKLFVRVPMDVWRQWIRHRMASVNEYSTRYKPAIDEMNVVDKNNWRMQASNNKQGSFGFISAEKGKTLSIRQKAFQEFAREIYQERLDAGVAKEQARMDLPLSTFTEAYWKIDLHNLMHFLNLRTDPHAQYEIRQYAEVINSIFKEWCPITHEAYWDYIKCSETFSRMEMNYLKRFAYYWVTNNDVSLERILGRREDLTDREDREFLEKLGLGR